MERPEERDVDQPAPAPDEDAVPLDADDSAADAPIGAGPDATEPPDARADEGIETSMDEPAATIDELSATAVGDEEPAKEDETSTVDEIAEKLEEEEPEAERAEAVEEAPPPDLPEASIEEPAAAEPVVEEPEAPEALAQESMTEEPAVESVAEEPPVEESPTEESVTEEPTEETPAEEPAIESVSRSVEVEPELAAAVEEALEGAEAEAEELPEWLPGEWFVVHTYAGYENKVKVDLQTRVASMNMEEKIYEVVIPMEKVMEVKGGKKVEVERKVFPGYLLVRMELDDDSWYVVRNTPGVTGFVGSGTRPIPLSEREVDRILQRKGEAEKPKPKLEWTANDPVRVTTGPFANFQGVISDVDDERQKVKVLVNIFGRETPVELSYDQIAKV